MYRTPLLHHQLSRFHLSLFFFSCVPSTHHQPFHPPEVG